VLSGVAIIEHCCVALLYSWNFTGQCAAVITDPNLQTFKY